MLCVKENQPTLRQAQGPAGQAALDGQLPLDHSREVDGDHGRIETREVWATDQVQHLRLPEPWPGLASVARVRRSEGGDRRRHQ